MYVVENRAGWRPSNKQVSHLRQLAKARGLISDWPVVSALANGDLLLSCEHITGELGADLIAFKKHGRWQFKTDGEELRGE